MSQPLPTSSLCQNRPASLHPPPTPAPPPPPPPTPPHPPPTPAPPPHQIFPSSPHLVETLIRPNQPHPLASPPFSLCSVTRAGCRLPFFSGEPPTHSTSFLLSTKPPYPPRHLQPPSSFGSDDKNEVEVRSEMALVVAMVVVVLVGFR
ncbi:sulfated surface glycoprotein 185-like [Helianthus annuus]|uniref:sulfated surface glycoprotein 185-like n=1 Tax=Helianthus annuus TaxID=4232 RepID=UPI00165333DD|nr:sulfated surface glycoprotein 185-like [Helianthus annuus]